MPRFVPQYASGEHPPTPTLGFELEFEWGPETSRTTLLRQAAALQSSSGTPLFAGFDDDGSLDDGAEYQTTPGTLAWWRLQWPTLTAWLRTASDAGCRAYDTSTCGGHVHVSYAHLNADGIRRVYDLVYGHRAFFTRVSQRTASALRDWASLTRGKASSSVIAAEALRQHGHPYTYWDWGNALDLSYRYPTIEFRLWRGTLSPDGWWRRLCGTDAVMRYAALPAADAPCTAEALVSWMHSRPEYADVVAWYATQYEQSRAASAAR